VIEGAVVSAANGAWENVVDGIKYRSEKPAALSVRTYYIYIYIHIYIYIIYIYIYIYIYMHTVV
jgi:hypothetical protein